MLKIKFIDPPNFLENKSIERVFGCTYTLYPMPNIFSLSCAAVLENAGFDVGYTDMANEGWGRKKVESFLRNDASNVYIFHSVNLSIKPDTLFVEKLREIKKDAYIIFTGPAPTYFMEPFLKGDKTIIVRGEAEYTMLALLRCLDKTDNLETVEGISWYRNKSIVNNPPRPLIDNLDELPSPARHLLNSRLYYNPKLINTPFTAIQTSRNCPYQCIFCVPCSSNFSCELEYRRYNDNKKPPVRMHSAEYVIREFESLHRDGYRSVSVVDDQFLWEEERTIKICGGIAPLRIDWGCLGRADRINDRIAAALVKSGCRYMDLGVESFCQSVLDDIKKDLKVEKAYEAINILKKHNIMVKINLLLGVSPLQTKDVIRDDVRKAKKSGVDAVMFSLATPFPGTDFYRRATEEGFFASGSYHPESVQSKAIISYPELSHDELEKLVMAANRSFYFSPRFMSKNIKRFFHPTNLYRSLIALKRKFI